MMISLLNNSREMILNVWSDATERTEWKGGAMKSNNELG